MLGMTIAVLGLGDNQFEVINAPLIEEEPYVTERRELSPRDFLLELDEYNFDLISRVINAESGWNPDAKNPNSSASGILQYLDGTFKAYCIDKYGYADSMEEKNNPYIQIRCGVQMISEPNGINHWDASRFIWGN